MTTPDPKFQAFLDRIYKGRFGDLEVHPLTEKLEDAPEVTLLHSERGGRADVWHTDVTFTENPPIAVNRSARTSRQAPETAKTSRARSCWDWSISPGSATSEANPYGSTMTPTDRNRSGWSQSTSLGPTMPALARNASATSSVTADGSSRTSSWRNSRKGAPSTELMTSLAAAEKPRSSSSRFTKADGMCSATTPDGSTVPPLSMTSTERLS